MKWCFFQRISARVEHERKNQLCLKVYDMFDLLNYVKDYHVAYYDPIYLSFCP